MNDLFDARDIESLQALAEYDPHRFLGLHRLQRGDKIESVVRIWKPGATSIYVEVLGQLRELQPVCDGLFVFSTPSWLHPVDYRIYHSSGRLACDPYAFGPTWGDLDQHLFTRGRHYQLDRAMGARLINKNGVCGVSFVLWAPNARSVSLVSDSNNWDGRYWPMRSMGSSGVWELFVPGLEEGERYKFEIHTRWGECKLQADPYALYGELRPNNASVVARVDHFPWTDQLWMQRRALGTDQHGYAPAKYSRPLSIYEIHPGSWKRKGDGTPLNYRELAHELVRYCLDMGYTHVELMPVMEHPFDPSWGYQVTGYFSVSARWGKVSDFQYLVNYLHVHGLGVILDWVPAHFPTDAHALANFDGTALYEHADPQQGFHPHWKTCIFNYGRSEVSNFLLASALFWCRQMHVDALRVDAVASMIYLDYGREEGEWIPNRYGGRENLEALELLRHFNSVLHKECPGVLTMAEESTSFTGITHSLEQGGLGFDFKWNMGWMNDTLSYMARDPIHRRWHQNELSFALVYAFSERFALVLSHDEVVHGKRSLLEKMPGDDWQKFASVRLLHSYMMCMPGKKLLFMGQDIGQREEWDFNSSIPWDLLKWAPHRGLQSCVREMNHFYLSHSELWHDDVSYEGFSWVNFSDELNSTLSYMRHSPSGRLLCIHNFTPSYYPHYQIHIPGVSLLREVFNSDDARYGGSGKRHALDIYNTGNGQFTIQLSPLATQIFEAHG